jgi:hypothetical protein
MSEAALTLEGVLELTRRMDRLECRVASLDPTMVSSATAKSTQLSKSGTWSP